MSAATISADGITWPLETYLDAMRFRRLDRWDEPRLDGQVRVVTVTRDGVLQSALYANEVRWADVQAYRPTDNSVASTPCRLCGDPTERLDDDICEDCEYDAEPGW